MPLADNHDDEDELFGQLLDAYQEAARDGNTDWASRLPPSLRRRLERASLTMQQLDHLWHTSDADAADRPADVGPTSESEPGSGGLAADPPLAMIGRFRPLREIGRGGFGVVYLADDTALNRPVALKVPYLPLLLDPASKSQFLREAQAAAQLDHPHIVPVYDAGEAGGVCYIASPYSSGPTLADWLRLHPGPVSGRDAAHVVVVVARAIAHTHARGTLHRDLKPANILLSPDADTTAGLGSVTPRVTDFGLAIATSSRAVKSGSLAILGTPEYMAPEQAAGESNAVGPAADVYALGAILYELVTGRPPFGPGPAGDVCHQVLTAQPVRPRLLCWDVPLALEAVCLKCLEKDPARRYPSAAALAEDLGRFLAAGERPTEPDNRRPPPAGDGAE